MSESSSGPDLLNDLAYDFAERYRRGERPSVSEYTDRHPELAIQIRGIQPLKGRSERLLARSTEPDSQLAQHILRHRARPGRKPGITAHPRCGRQDRDRQQRRQRVAPTARISGVAHRGEHVEQFRAQQIDAIPGAPVVQRLGNRGHG